MRQLSVGKKEADSHGVNAGRAAAITSVANLEILHGPPPQPSTHHACELVSERVGNFPNGMDRGGKS